MSDGVLAELERLGPQGAPLVAELTTASDKELAKLVALYERQGKAAATKVGEGLTSGVPKVRTAAAKAHAAAEAELTKPTRGIPVTVDGSGAARAAAIIRGNIDAYYRSHPVTIHVAYARSGTRPVRDVA